MHQRIMAMKDSKTNICQPGYNASCALCCGSHNFTADPVGIARILTERGRGEERQMDSGGRLFEDGARCPHVGVIDEKMQVIGCLVYRSAAKGGPLESFFEYTCRNFSCRARETLSEEEILFAARLMGDWYYYSLLINEITLLQGLFRKHRTPELVAPDELADLKRTLAGLLRETREGAAHTT